MLNRTINFSKCYVQYRTVRGKFYRAQIIYQGHYRETLRKWETATQAVEYSQRLAERVKRCEHV